LPLGIKPGVLDELTNTASGRADERSAESAFVLPACLADDEKRGVVGAEVGTERFMR